MDKKLLCVLIHAEVGTFNADGKLMARPEPVKFAVLEAGIPEHVSEWLWAMLPKEGGG